MLLQNPTLNDTGFAPTSQVHESSIFYYWLKEIKKYEFDVASNGIIAIPNFVKIAELVQKPSRGYDFVVVVRAF
jgi:hypothetical protein